MQRVRMAIGGLILFACSIPSHAQSPAAKGANQDDTGFYPGWTLGTSFEGSTSGDGSVYDLGTSFGYNFSHHFGVDLGVPYYFVGTPSAVKTKDPGAVSGNGIGNIGADLKWIFPGHSLTYASTTHLAAPTGDTKKGFSVGHATWNLANHFEHGWGNFTPFIDGTVGNTIPNSKYFTKLYSSFGYNLAFEAGTEVDAGPLSLSGSAYDIAPWGPQTVISKVYRCTSGTKCTSTGTTTDRKSYLNTSVSSGGASLTRDNGFNFGVEFKPTKTVDLQVGYSRSVPLRLNTFSFGISLDIAGALRSHR